MAAPPPPLPGSKQKKPKPLWRKLAEECEKPVRNDAALYAFVLGKSITDENKNTQTKLLDDLAKRGDITEYEKKRPILQEPSISRFPQLKWMYYTFFSPFRFPNLPLNEELHYYRWQSRFEKTWTNMRIKVFETKNTQSLPLEEQIMLSYLKHFDEALLVQRKFLKLQYNPLCVSTKTDCETRGMELPQCTPPAVNRNRIYSLCPEFDFSVVKPKIECPSSLNTAAPLSPAYRASVAVSCYTNPLCQRVIFFWLTSGSQNLFPWLDSYLDLWATVRNFQPLFEGDLEKLKEFLETKMCIPDTKREMKTIEFITRKQPVLLFYILESFLFLYERFFKDWETLYEQSWGPSMEKFLEDMKDGSLPKWKDLKDVPDIKIVKTEAMEDIKAFYEELKTEFMGKNLLRFKKGALSKSFGWPAEEEKLFAEARRNFTQFATIVRNAQASKRDPNIDIKIYYDKKRGGIKNEFLSRVQRMVDIPTSLRYNYAELGLCIIDKGGEGRPAITPTKGKSLLRLKALHAIQSFVIDLRVMTKNTIYLASASTGTASFLEDKSVRIRQALLNYLILTDELSILLIDLQDTNLQFKDSQEIDILKDKFKDSLVQLRNVYLQYNHNTKSLNALQNIKNLNKENKELVHNLYVPTLREFSFYLIFEKIFVLLRMHIEASIHFLHIYNLDKNLQDAQLEAAFKEELEKIQDEAGTNREWFEKNQWLFPNISEEKRAETNLYHSFFHTSLPIPGGESLYNISLIYADFQKNTRLPLLQIGEFYSQLILRYQFEINNDKIQKYIFQLRDHPYVYLSSPSLPPPPTII